MRGLLNRFLSAMQEEAPVRVEPQIDNPASAPQNNMPLSQGYPGSELYSFLTGGAGGTGMAVNEKTAMSVSAVYASVSLIAGAIASIPIHIYERGEDANTRIDHDYWWLLNEQPHPSLSAAVFWEYELTSLLLHGDAFARIDRPGPFSPRVSGFFPLHPLFVDVTKVDGRLKYTYYDIDGSKPKVYDQDDILHFPGIGFDGRRSMSPIKYAARQAIGVALAADEHSASFFRNGARPDFALETEGRLEQTAIDELRRQWISRYGGVSNRHSPAVLTGGLKLKEIAMTAEDAQLIATRRFQVEDIARIFGVPPHMIGSTEKTTSWGNGIEQMSIGFVKYTLQRFLTKIKQELNRKLFRTQRNFCEHNTAGLERGDVKTRYEAHRISLGRAGEPAWATINEVRRLENLPPVDGGNELFRGDTQVAEPAKKDNEPKPSKPEKDETDDEPAT